MVCELFCLPIGESKRSEFADAYKAMLSDGRGQAGAILLPSAFLIEKVREQLLESGLEGYETPYLFTFDDLVQLIVRKAGCKRTFLDRTAQELLVEELLLNLKATDKLVYFSNMVQHEGFVAAITSFLGELRRGGVQPDEFESAVQALSDDDIPRQKDKEIALLFRAYKDKLTEIQAADLEELYFLATDALMAGLDLAITEVYISDFLFLTKLQLEFIKELRNQANIHISMVYEQARSELYQAADETYTSLVGLGFIPYFCQAQRKDSFSPLRADIFRLDREPKPAPDLSLLKCAQQQQECDRVAGLIKGLLLTQKYQAQDIAVVVRELGGYTGLIDACCDQGIPLGMAKDTALQAEPVVELLLDFFTARQSGGDKRTVANILSSPFVADKLGIDQNQFGQAILHLVIETWEDWQRFLPSPYQNAFSTIRALAAELPETAVCSKWAELGKEFLAQWDILHYAGKAYKQKWLSLEQMKRLISTYKACGELLDHLTDSYHKVGLNDKQLTCADFLFRFLKAVQGQRIPLVSANHQGVRVLTPTQAGGNQFAAVCVMGLVDGEFPRKQQENWLYSDGERQLFTQVLGMNLKTAAQRRKEEDLLFAMTVGLAAEKLVLSTVEDAETLISPYIDDLTRLFKENSYEVKEYPLNKIFPAIWQEVYDIPTLLNKFLADKYNPYYYETSEDRVVQSHFKQLSTAEFERRVQAEQSRQRDAGSLYNGVISDPKLIPYCSPKGRVFSISSLESYASCPFKYFMSRVMKIDEWQDESGEIQTNMQGTIWHAVLAGFLTKHLGEILKPEQIASYQTEMNDILEAVCQQLEEQGELYCGRFFAYTYQYWQSVLFCWLEYEVACQNEAGLAFTPQYLEWSFDSLNVKYANDVVKVRGKIDRIDTVGDKFLLTDYKSGSTFPTTKATKDGKDLQIPLYIMAVEEYLAHGKSVVGGGYYSITALDRTGGMWREEYVSELACRAGKRSGHYNPEDWAAIQKVVSEKVIQAAAAAEQGFFIPQPEQGACNYCTAVRICRYNKYSQLTAEVKTSG